MIAEDVRLLKYVCRFQYGDALGDNQRKDGHVKVFGSNGAYNTTNAANTNGPVIVVGRKGSSGKVSWSDDPVYASDTAFYIDKSSSTAHLRWLYYALQTLNLDLGSQDAAVPGLNRELAYGHRVTVPPIEYQYQIAALLDQETTQIDDLIQAKVALLERLSEKRQALITQAVTSGLDPAVPMRDSGIPWLGEIPAHWHATRLKRFADKIGSGKTPLGGAEVYKSDGVMFIRSQNVYDWGLSLDDVVYVTDEIDSQMKGTRVYPQDILLNITGASLGRTCIVPDGIGAANVNQHVCIIRLKNMDFAPYVALNLKSAPLKSQIFSLENGTSREGLTFEQIGNLLFAFPPDPAEQKLIVEFVESLISTMHKTEIDVIRTIEVLRERRTTLIADAVAGRLNIP